MMRVACLSILLLFAVALPVMARQNPLSEKDKVYVLIKEAHAQKYPQLLKTFDEALKLNSNCAEVYEARAKEHLIAGRLDLAIVDCNRALKIDPDDEYAYLTRANANFFSGNYQSAIEDVNRYSEHDHGDRSFSRYQESLIKGASYYHLNKYADAIRTLSQVLRGDVGEICPDSYYYRGLSHYALGQYPEALADLNVSIKTNKNIPEYWLARANIFAKMGKALESAQDKKAASAVPPANKKTRYFLL